MGNKYSVLMSIYKNDSPEFLKEALESIYNRQTQKPDEIVLVIDGPISETLNKTIKNFTEDKKSICKCIYKSSNTGLGDALKTGVEHCSGNYIFRMDADDISFPDRFEKQIKYIEKNPFLDVIGGNIKEFRNRTDEEKTRRRVCPSSFDEIKKMAKKRNPINHVSVCIKKSTLLEIGNYQSLPYLEDYYLWLRMIVANKNLSNMSDDLVYVRIGNGFEKRRGAKEQIKGWDYIQDFMVENKLISKREKIANMIAIRGFVYMPSALKKIVYTTILRKKEKN